MGASIASNNTDGSRAITAPGLQQSLAGRVDGSSYQIFAEAAFDLVKAANTRAEPFGRVAYARVNSDAFSETGGIGAVNGASQGSDVTLTTLGVRGAIVTGLATISGSAGWAHTSGDRSAETLLSITGPNTPYLVNAAALDDDAVALEAQASFSLGKTMSLGVGYSGLIGSNNSDHGARATLSIGF